MRMKRPPSLRNRLLVTLLLVALIPSGIALLAGTFVLREVVVSTGTAGAWSQVAETGRALLERVEEEGFSPETMEVAEAHREYLAESVRLSRVYAFLGERVLGLLPFFSLGLLAVVGLLALLAANRLSRAFSEPVEELVGWTRSLATGDPLPEPRPEDEGREIREFGLLREALRSASRELAEARERELERAKIRSWAEMSRRIAHELKNPLTPMRMAAERVTASDDPRAADAGEVLKEEIARLDVLARSFAQFGRPPEGPMATVELNALLSELVRRLSTPELPIRLELPEEPVEVEGYLEPLERAVRNLVANALEAAGSGGDGAEGGTGAEIRLVPLETGAEILVLDRGPGLSPEHLDRIWEPEFTTKSRGTGLGLPMVRQVVEAHGGEVRAENRDEGGAEFRIRLPSSARRKP